MEKLFVSLAYKYVALALMMVEANHAIRQLDVPGWKSIEPTNVVAYYVSPPRLLSGGSVDTATHMFGFGRDGQLHFIHRRDPDPDLSIEERHQRWAKMKSLIGTNEAYQLATNWLVKLEVDISALEKAHPPQVTQEYYYRGGKVSADRIVMLPRYEVKWGTNQMRPAVWISIFGPTKEPIHIRQEDAAFSRRPKGLVKDVERLLSISNQAFASFTLTQKSNLVVESALASFPGFALPEVVRAQSTNAPERRMTPAPRGERTGVGTPQGKVHTLAPASKPKTGKVK